MGKNVESAELRAYKTAEQAYYDAKNTYDLHVSNAGSEVSKARKAKEKAIKAIEKDHKRFSEAFEQPIAKFVQPKSTVTLYRDHLESGKFRLNLESGMKVEVSTSGNTSATMIGTRDSRQLFINVLTAQGNMTVSCNPDQELQARDFAGQISVAAMAYDQTMRDFESVNKAFEEQVAAERRDTSLIYAAAATLESVKNDTSSIDQARKRMEEASGHVDQHEMEGHKARVRRHAFIKWGAIIAVAVVIVVCLFIF